MPLPKDLRYSYDDLLNWPEEERYELYDGRAVALASPTDIHQDISGELNAQLRAFLRGKPCKVYAAPLDVRLFEKDGETPDRVKTVVQPDIIVVCDRSKIDRHGIHGAPNLIIEILSEGTKKTDKIVKFNLYQLAGVQEYWIVDPDRRIVQVFTLEDGAYHAPEVYAARASVPVAVLPGCVIEFARVFDLI